MSRVPRGVAQIAKEKKVGFPLPMNKWMKDEKAKEILLDKTTLDRGIFDKNMIKNLNTTLKYFLKLDKIASI